MCIVPGSNYLPFRESLIDLDIERRSAGTEDLSHLERETLDLQHAWSFSLLLYSFFWVSITSLKFEIMMST